MPWGWEVSGWPAQNLFPTLTCGVFVFVFSVVSARSSSSPPSPPPPPPPVLLPPTTNQPTDQPTNPPTNRPTHPPTNQPPPSLGRRRSAGVICVAGAVLGALQGVGCTSLGRRRSRCDLRRGTLCSPRGWMYAFSQQLFPKPLVVEAAGALEAAGAHRTAARVQAPMQAHVTQPPSTDSRSQVLCQLMFSH